MSEDETDIEETDSGLARFGTELPFDELSNLNLSRNLELYKNADIKVPQRSRGILSKTDRKYLLGIKNYENEQSEANRRQNIRNRIKNSLQDFKLIWTLLEKNDRDQVFSGHDDETVDDSIEAMVSFIYLGLDRDIPRIEKAIKRGILAGESANSEGQTKQIDVSINIDYYPDVEATKEKMENHPLEVLTVEEIGVLVKAGELDPGHIKKMNDPYIHPPPGLFGSMKNEPSVDKDPLNYDPEEADDGSE